MTSNKSHSYHIYKTQIINIPYKMSGRDSRKKVTINKLALLLLSLVVLEMLLVGGQVESLKALKKKLVLKKFKKLLPLIALLKPKKKIILLPVG